MKIPNVENGKRVIYVQLKDLQALVDIEDSVAAEMILETIKKSNANLKSTDFIRLNDLEIIHFINSKDWILNYKAFSKSKSYEIEFQYMMAEQRLSLFKSSLQFTPQDESTIKEYKISNHKMQDIKQAIQSIVNNNVLIPMVEDNDEKKFTIPKIPNYKIQQSLNPNVFLLTSNNSTPVTLDDIHTNIITEVINLIINPEGKISVDFETLDNSTIICKVSKIKEKTETKRKRFFSRHKNKK